MAILAIALPTIDGPVGVGVDRASADPAPAATNVSKNTAGALAAGTVPDGTCFATASATGGGGASSSAAAGSSGLGGAGATINATFRVVPGQSYGGTVGAGAAAPTAGAGATAPGGAGDGSGGAGGTIVSDHRGGGGGGGSSVTFAGTKVLVAGGGGGGGAAHQSTPVGTGAAGGGGITGIGAGVAAVGGNGSNGVDNPNSIVVGGGSGGQAAAGGTGGTNSSDTSYNAAAGTGIGTGNGGNGGPDQNYDSGGGGGGGYTGGGGGASTVNSSVTGGGGGGGASWVRATSVDAATSVPTSITGVAGPATATGTAAGNTGSLAITWVPCNYDLALTKSVSSPTVNAGNKVTWTVTVKNNGPYPMTKGDTVDLTDTLPAGPNGAPAPAYKVTGFTDTPGTSGGLASGALTCSGVTVGSAMPASTNCSRAYSAPSAVGAPSGGVRGLDVNEQITITYEQIISNTAPCATITNTATVKDRPSGSIVTDTVNQGLTINCYDLSITKTANATTVTQGGTITWTIAVTNNGPGDMAGPVDTTANALVITDNFPGGASVNAPVASTQTGTAGPCTLSSSTITCAGGLASGATETLLYTQTVKPGAANNAVVNNTATVTDPKTGDSNDSSTGTTTVKNPPTLTLKKTVVARANAADQFTVSATHGATTDASATTSGAGLSATTAATNLTAGTTYTLTDAMAAGSVSVLGQYTKSISCTNSTAGSATTLPSGAGASFSLTPANGDVITCTFSNGPTAPTITFTKSISSRFASSDQFTAQIKNGAAVTASATTSGAGTTASTATTAVTAGTSYTLTEIMAGGTSALSDYTSSIACTNGTAGTGTALPSGVGQSFSVTPAAGDAISCTLTNAAKPHVTLIKSVGSRVVAADQFTVAIAHGAGPTTDASAATSGAGVSATTGVQGLVAGTSYTLSDAMSAGSTSTLPDYLSSIACTNSAAGSATTLPSGSGTSFALTPAAADNITCTITNTAKPHLTLLKSVGGRINSADQFTVAVKNGAATVASATTSGAGVSATTGSQALTAATTYTLTDTMAAGSSSVIGNYTSSIACSNTAGGSATTLPSGAGTSFSVTPANGDNITCTITNTPPAPKLTLTKSVASRVAAADQFTVKIAHGVTTDASATTSGAGVSATTGVQALTAGTAYTLTDAMAAGSTSTLADYTPAISCTNTTSSSATTLPSGAGSSFSLTPGPGDVITCTITNVAKPHVTLIKSVGSRVVAADQFTVAIVHGAGPTTDASATTSGAGVSATTGVQALTAGTAYTLTDAMAAGSSSTLSDYGSSIACTNATGGSATVLPSGSGTSFSLSPAAADNITCTITNTAKPHVTLVKSVGSRANASDQFTVAIKNGAATVASATTSGAGVSATTGSQTLTAATTYTLTDAMAGGSASVIGQYGSSIACTNTNGSSSTTLPSGTGTSFSLTPASGDNITCTISNTAGTATLGLTKNASPSSGVTVGTVITYTYGVTNTGSLPLTNVTVTDPHAGLSAITCAPAQGSTLAASATMSCSATYTVTQADVDAGSILNTGTVTGKDPSNNTVTKTAGKTVTATQSASLSLTKTALPASGVVAGDVVTYTFSGKNTGSVTLHNVTVTDPMPGLSALSCSPSTPTTLAPNATISCTATYTVTQANVDAGSFSNTATIAGLDPNNNPVSNSAGATVNTLRVATATMAKSALPASGVVAGDVVSYTMTGKNTGTVTLHNVTVTDPIAGLSTINCTPATPASLAPNATISCTATRTVTQADVDAGSIHNTATLSGLDPTNATVLANGSATVTANQVSTVALTKTANPTAGVVAGDVVTYTFGVKNTGTVTLHNVAVADPLTGLSALNCTPVAPATLAPNATMSCTATDAVTQADVDAGSIHNTATVTGLNPANAPVTNTASATVTANQVPALTVTKTATPNTDVHLGDTVTYTVTTKNTGTVTVHNLGVTDPMVGLSPFSCTPAAPSTLAPNATMSCTATHGVTQADVDAGHFDNTATATGLDPHGNPVTAHDSTTVTTHQAPAIALTKSATPSSGVVAGTVVTYTFTGTNTGDVTLHNVTVTDPMTGLSALTCTPVAPATLAPGATVGCSATYTVTQADVDAGHIDNTATIDGLAPGGSPVTNTGSTTVTADQTPALSLTKTATPNAGVVAGDIVAYTFHGQNTGSVTLHNVLVSDPMTGLSALTCAPTTPAVLAPGDTIDCSATYAVTQADVDAGHVDNTATIGGTAPNGDPASATAGATVTANQVTDYSVTKTASPDTGLAVGDVVTYTVAGSNTGTVTLHNVTVTDPMAGLSAFTCTPTTPTDLAPGAGISCAATYTVTQADVDAGTIANTATMHVTGSSKDASAVAGTIDDDAFTFTKVAAPDSGLVAGNVVTYTFTGTNTGSRTVHGVTVTDPLPGLSPLTCTPTTPAVLSPGAGISCTATYTVTQADVDAGHVDNTATIAGLAPGNQPVETTASATVTTLQTADATFTKSAAPTTGVVAGDTVNYTFGATNTGTVTLHNVGVTDPMPGLSAVTCTPTAPATLAPGDTIDCGATYTVTQADVDAGQITNTATLDALDPNDAPITRNDGAVVTSRQTADLTFTKTATPTNGVGAGDTVTYGFSAKNTGTVSLHNVGVTDPLAGLSTIACTPAAPATLAPGDTIDCNATYTVTQADVDAGSIHNTATVSGVDPNGAPLSRTSSATVTTASTAQLALTKTATPNAGVVAGNTVTYDFVGTNTGTVTLHNVTVTDPMTGLSALACTPGTPATLAPGDTVDCSATYTVTQADIDAGSIVNTATIHGLDPSNAPISATGGATVNAAGTAGVSLTKTATPNTNVNVGDTVTYSFTGTNTGDVSLHNVAISDPMTGLSPLTCTPVAPATVAPGGTIDCSATYTVTQADVDAGSISNTATITGLDPSAAPVSDTAGATVTADQTASVSLTKTASPSSGLGVGDTVTYTMVATNTGAVSLHNVTVTDPMTGLSAIGCTPAAPATLATGATTTCTATYTVTQADVDAGQIDNTATVDGLDPANNPVSDSASRTVFTGQAAGVTIVKTATPTSGVALGDQVTYDFAVANSGGLTLHNVSVTDPMTGLSAIACTPATPATLAPGATMDCSATYTVTQADVNAGSIVNTATVDGLDPGDNPVSDSDAATVQVTQAESLAFTKTASPSGNIHAGDVITYTMTAHNDGTVTLDNTVIADPMPNLSALVCTPAQGASLAPGDSMTCTATYTVTAADVSNGTIANTATVHADGFNGHPTSNASTAVVPTGSSPDVTLTKKLADLTGDTATWSIVVANTGTAALPGPFTVTDDLPAGLAFVSATGNGWVCTGTAPISCVHAADLSAGTDTSITVVTKVIGSGKITNTASIDVLGKSVSSNASVTPTDPGGFAFTGAEVTRWGLIGLLLVVGGWFLLGLARKRDEDPIVEA